MTDITSPIYNIYYLFHETQRNEYLFVKDYRLLLGAGYKYSYSVTH